MILKHYLISAYCIWQVWEDWVKTQMQKQHSIHNTQHHKWLPYGAILKLGGSESLCYGILFIFADACLLAWDTNIPENIHSPWTLKGFLDWTSFQPLSKFYFGFNPSCRSVAFLTYSHFLPWNFQWPTMGYIFIFLGTEYFWVWMQMH